MTPNTTTTPLLMKISLYKKNVSLQIVKPDGDNCPPSQSICWVPGLKPQCWFSTNQSDIIWLNRMLFSLNAHVVYNLPSAKLMSYLYTYKMDLNAKKLINVVLCHMTISTIAFTSKNIKNFQDTSQNFCQLLLCDKAITLQVHNKCSKKGKPLTHKTPVITKSVKTYMHSKVKLHVSPEQL